MLTTWRRQKKLVEGFVDVLYSAVNEEDDFTVFHNDLVEHNTDDGMEEKKD